MLATTDKKIELTAEQKTERYTPAKYIRMVKEVFGGEIELDPASCEEANKVVGANRFFTIEDNGLEQSWQAETLFLNPPYRKILPWVNKLLTELSIHPKLQAILLVNVCTDTEWFKEIYEASEFIGVSICFVKGRIKFYSPYTNETDTSPEKPSMFVCFGHPDTRGVFKYTFSQIGHVVEL